MQTQNPFLDEFAKLTSAAMGLAQTAGDEAKAAFRAQADRFVADFDLVRRDDLDALKAGLDAVDRGVEDATTPAPSTSDDYVSVSISLSGDRELVELVAALVIGGVK